MSWKVRNLKDIEITTTPKHEISETDKHEPTRKAAQHGRQIPGTYFGFFGVLQ
jgi:hypothetical protein